MIIQNAPEEPLSEVLGAVGYSAVCSVRLTAGGDWGIHFRPTTLKFNAIQRGECWLLLEKTAPTRLQAGDCFIVARQPFTLASTPQAQVVDAVEIFDSFGASANYGVGDDVTILGGSVAFSAADESDVLDLLPPAMVIQAGGDRPAAQIAWLLDQLEQEWRSDQPGARLACNDLLRLMFVHALRQSLSSDLGGAVGWLAGLNDRAVAAALKAVHKDPTRIWRLPELAGIAGLSRAGFAARFKAKVGRPPVEYAAIWRMRIAARRLRESRQSVSAVAQELGFLSDSAFGAAFRRVYGISPGRYRAASASSDFPTDKSIPHVSKLT